MAVNFNDDTWKYVEQAITEQIARQQGICTSPASSFKDIIRAQGAAGALKQILNLPRVTEALAATQPRK